MSWHLPVYQAIVQSALASCVLLALASAAVLLLRQPARRVRVIELSLAASLLLPWIGLLPDYPRLGLLPTPSSKPIAAVPPVNASRHPKPSKLAAPVEVRPKAPVAVPVEAVPFESLPIEPAANPQSSAAAAPDPGYSARPANGQPLAQASTPSKVPAFDYRLLVVVAYLIGASVMLLWSLLGWVAARRLVRGARPAPEACREILVRLAGPAAERVKLIVSDRATQPCALLAWQPTIVLPAAAASASAESVRLMLAHEWSHVSRGDVWSWWLAGLVRAVFWFQPFVWWLREQLRLSQDYLADDAAARVAGTPEDYAEFLTRYTASLVNPSLAAGLGIGGRSSNLRRRVVMLIDRSNSLETAAPRAWSVLAAAFSLILVAAVGTLGGQETVPEAETKSQPDAEQALAPPVGESNLIQPMEFLFIDVSPKLTNMAQPGGTCLVEPGGNVALGPGYGRVKLAGLTVERAEQRISEQLAKFLREPRVQVRRGPMASRRDELLPEAHEPLEPGDQVVIRTEDVPLVDGSTYTIEPQGTLGFGTVPLGPDYGRVSIGGLSWEQAAKAIEKHLSEYVRDPHVQVTPAWQTLVDFGALYKDEPVRRASDRVQPRDLIEIRTNLEYSGELKYWPVRFPVEPQGTVALGPRLGRVKIAGLTYAEAEAEVTRHLRTLFRDPQVSLTLAGYSAAPKLPGQMPSAAQAPGATTDAGSRAAKIEPGNYLMLEVAAAPGEELRKKLIVPPVSLVPGSFNGPLTAETVNHLEFPILVQPDGDLCLGPICGRVMVAGQTAGEADETIARHLAMTIKDPKVQVVRHPGQMPPGRSPFRFRQGDPVLIEAVNAKGTRFSRPLQAVEADGLRLGARFGRLQVEGLTIAEAEKALREQLAPKLDKPQVAIYVALELGTPLVPEIEDSNAGLVGPLDLDAAQPAVAQPDPALQPLDTIEVLLALKPNGVYRGVGIPGEPDIRSDTPQFSGTYVIEPDGDLALPHGYGRVKAAGLQPKEVGSAIRNRLTERMFTRTALPKVHVIKRGKAVFAKDRTPGPGYKIRPGDRVLMSTQGPEQAFNSLVNEAGELVEAWLQQQPPIKVSGLTLAEAEQLVRTEWKHPSMSPSEQPWFVTIGGWHEEADPDVIDQIEGNDETRVQRIERELQELKSLIRGMQK